MARFRKRRSRRGGFFRKSRGRSRSSSNPMDLLIPAALYGAARPTLTNLAAPVISMIPAGQYADELLMGVAGYFAAKKGSGIVKKLGMAALTVEAASLGYQMVGAQFGGTTANNLGGAVSNTTFM